jgi:hypothetical protein
MRKRCRLAGTAALNLTPSPHARTVTAIAIHRAKAWGQGAIVRCGLLRSTRSTLSGLIIITQQADLHHQGANQFWIQLFPATTTQRRRQHNIAEARTDQATHRQANRLKHSTHLAVAPLIERDAIPTIAAFATQELNHSETSRTIVKLDPIQQRLALLRPKLSKNAHRVLALIAIAGMQQSIR